MMDKKPFELRYPMFLYNAVLVLTNFYLILEVSNMQGQHKQTKGMAEVHAENEMRQLV